MQESEDAFYDSPLGQLVKSEDHHGPDKVWGVTRYPDYPDGTDFSDAILDPDSEAVGRYLRACSLLEIALFRARSELTLDPDMTYAKAERSRRADGCIKDLRQMSEGLSDRSRAQLLDLLERAEQWLLLRHGVVHGTYRKNHRTGKYEGRRYVLNKETRQFALERVPYDRDSLLLAMTRASNTTADILDGVEGWSAEIRRPEEQRIRALGSSHALRVEPKTGGGAVLHALGPDARTLCGRDTSGMTSHFDALFMWSTRKHQCPECQRLTGV